MRLVHERHLVDPAVTGDAADALLDVDLVVEVHEVGQVVDPNPVERRVVPEARADRLEDRRVGPDLRVAVHAGLGRRNAGEGGLLDRRVAVAAVEADAADVMGVAELDGLLDELVLLGHPGERIRVKTSPPANDRQAENACEAHAGEGVGAARKNLTHTTRRSAHSLHGIVGDIERVRRREGVPPAVIGCGRAPGGRLARRVASSVYIM